MPSLIIPYHSQKFGSNCPVLAAKPDGELNCIWEDVVWSAITVGKFNMTDLFQHGRYSRSEIRFKLHMLYANLKEQSGSIARSTLYNSLDSTEKGAISYFLGMMTAKLCAYRFFNTPWLVHFEKLRHCAKLIDKSRPDLVGLNGRRNWIVVEAKGRTNVFSQVALDKAKAQTRQLRRIAGDYPVLRVAIEAFFDSCLSAGILDPEEYDDDAVDLRITVEDYLRAYYKPFIGLIDDGVRKQPLGDGVYLLAQKSIFGVSIGVRQDVMQWVLSEKPDSDAFPVAHEDTIRNVELDGKRLHVYPDGIVLCCDERWSSERMVRDPADRQ